MPPSLLILRVTGNFVRTQQLPSRTDDSLYAFHALHAGVVYKETILFCLKCIQQPFSRPRGCGGRVRSACLAAAPNVRPARLRGATPTGRHGNSGSTVEAVSLTTRPCPRPPASRRRVGSSPPPGPLGWKSSPGPRHGRQQPRQMSPGPRGRPSVDFPRRSREFAAPLRPGAQVFAPARPPGKADERRCLRLLWGVCIRNRQK